MLSMPPATTTLTDPARKQVVTQHGRLHARTADFVYRGRADLVGNTGGHRRLAGRCLAKPGRQNATHEGFTHILTLKAGIFECGPNCRRTQRCRGRRRQFTLGIPPIGVRCAAAMTISVSEAKVQSP